MAGRLTISSSPPKLFIKLMSDSPRGAAIGTQGNLTSEKVRIAPAKVTTDKESPSNPNFGRHLQDAEIQPTVQMVLEVENVRKFGYTIRVGLCSLHQGPLGDG